MDGRWEWGVMDGRGGVNNEGRELRLGKEY